MKLFQFKEKEPPRGEYREDILKMIEDECRRRHEERRPLELKWMLCSDFFSGHQYRDINPYRGELEDYEPPYDYMERGVYNRIAPLVETRIANFKSLDFSMAVHPATSELSDYEKSLVATRLLTQTQYKCNFSTKKDSLILWSELCGTAFLLSWWDSQKGDTVFDGEKNIPLGDLDFGVITAYEVLPESIYKENLEDQSSIIIEQVVSVGEIDRRFGVRVKPRDVDTYALVPVAGVGGLSYVGATFSAGLRKAENATLLRTYMEKPTARHPSGRMFIATPDRILYYGTLPIDEYPISMLRSKRVAGMFFGRSVIEDLIPLQRAYNGVKNKIHDYIRSLALNPLLVPEGSVDDIDELAAHGVAPGDIVEYDPDRGEPKPLSTQNLPTGVFDECENLSREMEYVAGLSHLGATGNSPTTLNSASAIESLRSIDGVRLALTGDAIRHAVLSAAKIWLKLYKTHGEVSHIEKLSGGYDKSAIFVWCGEDINSYDVVFDSENSLLHSDASRIAAIKNGISMGLFDGEDGKIPRLIRKKLLYGLRLGDFMRNLYEDDLQSAAARRENMELVEGNAVEVSSFDDHELHIAEHRRAALEYSYYKLRRDDPIRAAVLENHIKEHEEKKGKTDNGTNEITNS
ncbi:MAG: hypothetical protein E7598_06070 [Ruminococcaceae bacterium]|nr:hypothetical protein [Oscillospiraceae bacterium]